MLGRFSKLLMFAISIIILSAAASAFNYTCLDPGASSPTYSCVDSSTVLTATSTPYTIDQCTQVNNPTAKIDLGDGNCLYMPTTPAYPNIDVDLKVNKAFINCSGVIVYAGNHSNPNCVVSVSQTILPGIYYFTNFTVNAGVTITVAQLSIGVGGGGGAAGPGSNGASNGGVDGGPGGALLKSGGYSASKYNNPTYGDFVNAPSGYAGGFLVIQASNIILKGVIDASGTAGNAGAAYPGTCSGLFAIGQGGGGGGGGGYIIIKSNTFVYAKATAAINANGGAGGPWGRGTCGGGCDNAAHGGVGGGGNSGQVELYTRNNTGVVCNNVYTDGIVHRNGGGPGINGGWDGAHYFPACTAGYGGTTDSSTDFCQMFTATETDGLDPFIACNDGIDNDNNGQTDMNDSACYSMINGAAKAQGWDTHIYQYFNTSKWFNPSAANGSDLSCGDDAGTCHLQYADCSQFGTDTASCQSAGCALTGSCDGTATTSCGNYQISDASGCAVGCNVTAPLGCFPNATQIPCGFIGPTGTDTQCAGAISCNQYNSQFACQATGCTWTPATICSPGPIINNICTGLGPTACQLNTPACALSSGFRYDYGYVTPDKQNMCYNTLAYLLSPSYLWEWLGSQFNSGLIYTLNNSDANNAQVDTISNGDQWFYSNANPFVTAGLSGNPIKEYSTFPTAAIYQSDVINCTFFMDFVDQGTIYKETASCLDNTNAPCCRRGTFQLSLGNIDNCHCYAPGATTSNICDLYATGSYPKLAPFCGDAVAKYQTTTQIVGKDQMRSGGITQYYNPGAICDMQLDHKQNSWGKNCTGLGQACMGGKLVITSDTNGKPACCFGDPTATICVDKDQTCPYGTMFNITQNACDGDYYFISGTRVQYCCIGTVTQHALLTSDFFGAVANNQSFIAFKENGNSMLGECCYQDCANAALLGQYVDSPTNQGRVVSSGNTLHSVSTFDTNENGQLIDTVLQVSASGTLADVPIDRSVNLSHFSYLEFDITYDNYFTVQDILLQTSGSTVDYGPLTNYLTNGNRAGSPRHAVIPINPYQAGDVLQDIEINISQSPVVPFTTITIDNIRLTPAGNDLQFNSQNYYCAGGFSAWIDSLDPNLTRYPFSLTSASSPFYADFDKGYGKYMEACNDQAAFNWTGHQCCGNNKYPDNYGEFYADIFGGCFNSTYIGTSQSIPNALGYDEALDKSAFDALSTKDIMYNDTNFYGCQVPAGKYNWLKTSYDGSLLQSYPATNPVQGNALALQPVNPQCAQIGNYYCFDNAWHNYVPGYGDVNTEVSFKSAPPGGDLVFNGGFNG